MQRYIGCHFPYGCNKEYRKIYQCPDKRNRIGRKRNYTLFTEGAYFFANQPDCIYSQRNGTETGLEFRKKLEKLQQTIQEFLVNRGVEIDFLIGIGKTVTGYHELKESFKSSKIALKYIKVIRRIIGDEDKSVIDRQR